MKTLTLLLTFLATISIALAAEDPPLNVCMINRAYKCMMDGSAQSDSDRDGLSESDYCTSWQFRNAVETVG